MNIRMHIIEESKAEWREMPQEYYRCNACQNKSKILKKEHMIGSDDCKWKSCRECGTIIDDELKTGAIKEPRFHKCTNHMDPMLLYQQMCVDEVNKLKLVVELDDRNEDEEIAI